MHFDGFSTIEGRHLVFAYILVAVIQLGYVAWIATNWLKLDSTQKKSAKPTV